MTCGIYSITHIVTGKMYIGQSVNIERRWKAHVNGHKPSYIYRAIKKHGVDAFNFTVVEECNRTLLDDTESKLITKFNTIHPNGYNLKNGGDTRGCVSKITRLRMSIAGKKRAPLSDLTKLKMGKAQKDKTVSDATKKRMSESAKNISDETRCKMSKAAIGQNNKCAKLSEHDVCRIKQLLKHSELMQREIGAMFNVNNSTICDIKRGRTWSHITI